MTDVLLFLLLAMAVTAGVTLWVTFQVAAEDRLVVGLSTGALALGLCIALAFTTYRAIRARRTAGRLRALESGLARLVDGRPAARGGPGPRRRVRGHRARRAGTDGRRRAEEPAATRWCGRSA